MVSQFIDSPPIRVEVRGGLVYYIHADAVFTQPIAEALKTFEMVKAATDEWFATHQHTVVPFERKG